MINEHTPNSALINDIARYAPNRTEHQVAAAEYDKRFPVSAPVDRRSLDCFTHCQVGDEIWVDGESVITPIRRVSCVISRDGVRSELRLDDGGVVFGDSTAYTIRWPQPAPWYEALKPGDKYEANFGGAEEPWHTRTFQARNGEYLVHAWGQNRIEHCRPLPPRPPRTRPRLWSTGKRRTSGWLLSTSARSPPSPP